MANRANGRLDATAHHEAGHAVATMLLSRAVRCVSIVPDGDALGRCEGTPERDWFHPSYNNDGRTRRRVEQQILITLAGPAAERHCTGRRNVVGWWWARRWRTWRTTRTR